MRALGLVAAAAAAAAFAFEANAQSAAIGMGSPPTGAYQTGAAGDGPMAVPDGAASDGGGAYGIGFHAGGVGACDGCHVMHNAASGVAKSTTGLSGEPAWNNRTNAYLLQAGDQSSTCLVCHGSTTAMSAATPQFVVADLNSGVTPSYRSPGGDFGWLQVTFPAAPGGVESVGEGHGHNVAARDFGWEVDTRFAQGVAPGGTYVFNGTEWGQKFACSSCHDPHGRYRMQQSGTGIEFAGPFVGSPPTLPIVASGSYGAEPTGTYAVGSYRLLAGKGYDSASRPGFPFTNDPPVAVAPKTYNRSEASAEVRVNYGTGMSEWCQNCHTNIHQEGYASGTAGLRHPAGSEAFLRPGQYNLYNTYVSSGVVDASLAASYTSLVPFEQGGDVPLATLRQQADAGTNIVAGPTSTVMCLSCHRAHASAFDSMLRWDMNATFLTDSGAGLDGFASGLTLRTAAATSAGYYDRVVGDAAGSDGTRLGYYQRSLCNKCHSKD